MASEGDSRRFEVREADWSVEGDLLSAIRREVFVVEQQVPPDEEWDGRDHESWHFVALDGSDGPIGTARLLPDGQIGRMAVLEAYRRAGVGGRLLEEAVVKARAIGLTRVYLHAQIHALPFYERAGFVVEGEEFEEAGISHRRMSMALLPAE
ncbi:MAG: GNAT family N-acetyltransferase [Deltaproteobacteria bacterium]|jgi:predicted GNAT family N-acyltransferase|nr:GNAT family N-acetyltransferase [Deltaproteobacteria bacterium]MBW2497619.1 GNAT family N-acetyltransferase [Deltaproteobacteria bacterium]